MATRAVTQETIVALRHQIARIERRLPERMEVPCSDITSLPPHLAFALRQPVLPTGVMSFDTALGGGLPLSGLIELHSEAVRDSAATIGFALALSHLRDKIDKANAPLLWIGTTEIFREAGRPHAPGLASRFALAPSRLLVAEASKLVDALWIAEEAANTGLFCTILLELRGSPKALDLTATRRLHRRALITGRPFYIIRQSGAAQPTAAPLRLHIGAGPAAERHTLNGPLSGSIGPPAFRVTINKTRARLTSTFTLEWNHDAFQQKLDPTHSGALVSVPAGQPADAVTLRTVLAFPCADERPGVQPSREQHAARHSA